MHEALLRGFLVGQMPADALKRDLVGTVVRTSSDVFTQHVVPMDGECVVTKAHLIRLCDAVLAGQLAPEDLEPISFCIVASDSFSFDEQSPETEVVLETLHDWDSPEINYPLTMRTVSKFRHRLVTGEDTFTREDIAKQKKG